MNQCLNHYGTYSNYLEKSANHVIFLKSCLFEGAKITFIWVELMS